MGAGYARGACATVPTPWIVTGHGRLSVARPRVLGVWGTAAGAAPWRGFVVSVTRTYLELSQDGGGAHKFYEVTVAGLTVTVRYGRIGAAGQVQTSAFPTVDKAQAAAAKKIGE